MHVLFSVPHVFDIMGHMCQVILSLAILYDQALGCSEEKLCRCLSIMGLKGIKLPHEMKLHSLDLSSSFFAEKVS